MEKKYVLRPGWVISKNDGDRHYINAPTLARLYGVPMSECIVITKENIRYIPKDLIQLRPRFDGRYSLHQLKEPPRDDQGSGRKDGEEKV